MHATDALGMGLMFHEISAPFLWVLHEWLAHLRVESHFSTRDVRR